MATLAQFNTAVNSALGNKNTLVIPDSLDTATASQFDIEIDEAGNLLGIVETRYTVTITTEEKIFDVVPRVGGASVVVV